MTRARRDAQPPPDADQGELEELEEATLGAELPAELGEVVAADPNGIDRIAAKLVGLMGECRNLEKRGWNARFQYAFVRDTDVLAAVQAACVNHRVAVFVSAKTATVERVESQKGAGQRHVTLEVRIRWVDADSGQQVTTRLPAEGMDTQDKASSKALGSGIKYGLLKTLLISTGELEAEDDGNGAEAEPPIRGKDDPRSRPDAAKGFDDARSRADKAEAKKPAAPAATCECPHGPDGTPCGAEVTAAWLQTSTTNLGTPRCGPCYPAQRLDRTRHPAELDLGLPRHPGKTAGDVYRAIDEAAAAKATR